MLPEKTSSKTKRLYGVGLICLCIPVLLVVFQVLEPASVAVETSADVSMQKPGLTTRRTIVAGVKDVLGISVDQGKLLRFSIDKGDLVLSTTLYSPTGERLLEHVSQDFEVVEISYPADVGGVYRIEVLSREKPGVSSQYELTVPSLLSVTARDRKDSDARQAMADAEVLRATWKEASLRKAVGKYEEAAQTWTDIRDFSNASRAMLKSGDLLFLFSEYPEALKRYQNAVAFARKSRDRLAEATALSQIGRLYSYTGNNYLAQEQITKATDLLKKREINQTPLGQNVYGEVLSSSAEIIYAKGDLYKSSRQFESALKTFRGDRKGQARVHLFKAYIAGTIGEPDKALSETSQALDLYRAINNRAGEGQALTLLGTWHSFNKNEDEAMRLHRDAIEIFQAIGDRPGEAIALNGVGQSFENLHVFAVALEKYENALRLFQSHGAQDFAIVTTFKLARLFYLMENSDQALAYYQHCLSLSRAAKKVRTEAIALTQIAAVYASQGRHEQTLAQYKRLQQFYERIGDRRGQAVALNSRADFLLKIGQTREALDVSNRALASSKKIGDNSILLATIYNLARAYRNLGNYEVALTTIYESIKIIEHLRENVGSPDLRASYFSGVRKHYELCADILMQLDRIRPGEGFAIAALLTNEKGKARSLIDLIRELPVGLQEGEDRKLRERERELRGLFASQAQYAMDLSLSKGDATEVAQVNRQMAELKADYEVVLAQLRAQNPHLASIAQFEPVTLVQIQKQLLDNDTILLEYGLGDERSYLYAITTNSFHSYELPARKIIEDIVTEFYECTTARQGFDGNSSHYQTKIDVADKLCSEKANQLSRMLLGPVAQHLGTRRLAIVKEGILQHISFDALTVPVPPGGPGLTDNSPRPYLIETNEIVGLPSISTLLAIRTAKKRAAAPDKLVAVIADPVFSRSDDRVQGNGLSTAVAQAAPDVQHVQQILPPITRDGGPVRLTHASEEADAISAAAPGGTTFVAKGFDASRETVMNSRIGEYQIVHFATHGFLDNEHPELSGVVLTMVDRNGVEKNGVLPLNDIYNLNLSAELTVLSACQTALGKDIKGEGLVGLTHSFLSAGSKSVVASLWKVDDRATARLMTDFYQAMLQQGMAPSAALRSAKLKMLKDKRWSAPYYWAGFVMQGEYTNRIVVDRHSFFGFKSTLLSLLVLASCGLIFFLRQRHRSMTMQRT